MYARYNFRYCNILTYYFAINSILFFFHQTYYIFPIVVRLRVYKHSQQTRKVNSTRTTSTPTVYWFLLCSNRIPRVTAAVTLDILIFPPRHCSARGDLSFIKCLNGASIYRVLHREFIHNHISIYFFTTHTGTRTISISYFNWIYRFGKKS